MDPQSPSASQTLAMPVAGGEDALRATLAAALEALETERQARRRAEAAVLERDRKLDEVERLASLGSWEQTLADPLDRQPVRWSAEQLRIHGLTPESAPATFADFLERVHPDDREPIRQATTTVVRTGDSNAAAYRVVRGDGEVRWLYAQAQRIADPDGGPARLIGTARDVTEHHLAEAALRERERTLDEVEELAALGTWEWHLPSDTITWSREQRIIHGLAEDQGTQTFGEFLDRVHPDDRGRVVEECERLLATRVPFSFPYRVVRPDGSLREMHALGKLLPDPAGTGERMVGISQDVTERNAADRALRESEARYRDLFEQFPHSVKVYAPDGTVVRINRAYERLWGLNLRQVQQFNPLRDVQMSDIGAMVRRAFAGETVVLPAVLFDPREYSPEIEPPAGMEWPRWVQASYFPIRGADGQVLEVVAVHQDVTDHRVAEEALRTSEESYRTIFEHSNDAIFVTDPETGSVVDANRRACEMCDTTLDELRADAASIIWNGPPPFTAQVAREQTLRALAGEAQRFEWMSVHPRTGAPIWGEVSLQRVMLAGKMRVLALVRDIGERKAAEEALRRSEESYRTIFELSNDPIYVHDVETGAILDANRRACEAAGMTLDEVRAGGMRLIAGGPEPFTHERAMEYVRLASRGEPQRFEWMTGLPADGQVWSEVSLNRVNIGGVDRLVATARDITERKQAEQALRDREESYRTIFDCAGAGLWVHDLDTGAFLDVNQTAAEMYGWPVEEQKRIGVAGLSWGEPPYTVDDAFRHVAAAIQGEPQRFEWKGRHRDGRPVWAEITLRRVTILGEDRLLATAREISDFKAAQDELRRANEELEERVRERTTELAEANEALEEEVAEHEAAQEALLERTQELEGVFHALPDIYFRLDPDGTITDHRAGRAAAVYAPLPEFRGRRMQELLPPETGARFAEALEEARRTGALEMVEYRLMDGDVPLEFEGRIVPLADGTLVTVVRDITERKAVERELERRRREAEQVAETLRQQALVFETLAEAVVITRADGRIQDWNPAAERMFGYHQKAVPGRPGGFALPLDREPFLNATVMAALDRDGSWSGEVPFVRPDGSEGVAEVVVVPQVDTDGRRIALISAHRDVTARKQAEAEVVRQKAFFEEIIASLESGVAVFDPELRYVYASPNSVRDADIREWIIGKTVQEYGERKGLSEAVIHIRQDGLERARDQKRTTEFEETLKGADGPRHVIRRSLPVLDENGELLRIIGYSVDITERVRIAEVLKQSEEHFRRLIENAHDITCILEPDGRMRYISPSAARVLGFDPEELEGRDSLRFIHPDDRAGVNAALATLRQDPMATAVAEYRFRHADGTWRHLEAVGRLLTPEAPDAGFVSNIRDVTERRHAEEALREATQVAERARADAERANLAKSEFLSRMSHELRTPMNSILGFGQVLARADLRADQQKHVQHILKAGRHLLRLINEVLEIARIEAGRQSFSLEPVHVGTVIQEAIGLVRPMSEQYEVEVEEGPGTGRDGFVHADRQRLTQVLLNLLSNAIKYNHAGGTVRLTCEDGGVAEDGEPLVWLRVEDTGQGIPEARVHQLFTPFARLGAEQTEVEGTGLGLALSLRLAEAMGGTLELERSGSEGSVFRLGLHGASHPLRRAEDAGMPAAAAEDAEHGTAQLLYIEDNLANLDLVETFLATRPGWKLVPALQGRIGVDLAREHRPDLVLLDLHLPDISGEEVLRRLRADPRTAGIPVIIISADATRDSLERLRALGADAYLTKPLDLDDFLSTLETHLPTGGGR
jgi:PAS domain S-box-containing protein